jgi:hypothetical protein
MKRSAGNGEKARQTEVSQQQNKQQDQCNPEHEQGGLGTSASQGRSARDDEDKTDNPIGEKRDSSGFSGTERGKSVGGILRQLIAENNAQLAEYRSKLAEYQSKIEDLEQRRYQLREFYEQLQAEIGQGEDDELPEEELREDEGQTRSEEE